jgi:type II secretory pathway component PulF
MDALRLADLSVRIAGLNLRLERATARWSFGTGPRLRFYERLAGYLEDGRPLEDALAGIDRRWQAKKKSTRWVTASLRTALRDGQRLSAALREGGWSPTQEIVLIEAGERAGDLAQGLGQAIYVTSSLVELRSSLVKGLAYPAFLLSALLGLFVFYGTTTVPAMLDVIPLDQWPDSTRPFYYVTTGLVAYGPWLGLGLAALAGLSLWSLPRWRGRWRDRCDRLPPWSIYRTIQGASSLIAVGGLLATGTPLATGLGVIEASASPWLAQHIAAIRLRIRTGMAAGDAMDMHLFDFAELGDDLADYGRLSNFERAVITLGRRSVQRVLALVAAGTAILNTALILLIAGSVLWMYLSFMTVADSATRTFR